jgi:hypothetical protein
LIGCGDLTVLIPVGDGQRYAFQVNARYSAV